MPVKPFIPRHLTSAQSVSLCRSFLEQAEQQAMAAYANAVSDPLNKAAAKEYEQRVKALENLEPVMLAEIARLEADKTAEGPA